MITPHNILRHVLIGLKVNIVDSTHPGYKCSGVVVDETRDTLSIKDGIDVKTLPKNCIILEVHLPGKEVVKIDGKILMSRPEDRIKKKHRIKFV